MSRLETKEHFFIPMIIKPTTAKLTAPCNQCGASVPIQNSMAAALVSARGIVCPGCLGGDKWTQATYQEYLQSDHWRVFRTKALAHYGRKCYLCGTEDGQIDLHHNDYSRLGHERLSDVVPLCRKHHELYEASK